MQSTWKPGGPSAASSIGVVRSRILDEHAKIRAAVVEVDRLALAVASEDFARIHALRAGAEKLYGLLIDHLQHEDDVVAPIIRQIDAWGPVRYEQMQRDHASQRAVLAQAIRDLEKSGELLGRTVQSTCWEILHDMRREEHDLLHPDLWGDDIMTVEFGG